MSWLAACGLDALHVLHIVWTSLVALLYYPFVANPQPLQAQRTKLPTNLALVLYSTRENPSEEEREIIIQTVVCAVRWCRKAGVKHLSVYDRHGLVTRYSEWIRAALPYDDAGQILSDSECSSDGSDSEYPPTPPLTDVTDSRPISPENRCSLPSIVTINLDSDIPNVHRSSLKRKQATKSLQSRQQNSKSSHMVLSLVSYEASKPFMASVARTFTASGRVVDMTRAGDPAELGITVESVDKIIQESLRLPPPDLMIVHSIEQHSLSCPPLELHGFPPWLIRLTEIYYDERPSLSRAWQNRGNKRNFVPLSEENFRRALDSYAHAEMRLGK